jgi:cytochrome c oxidase cbb3-type subunit 3/ubiquinol-cytochrome c reductase cytochrome c subunit
MPLRWLLLGSIVTAAAIGGATPGCAGKESAAESGAALYGRYCALCHGDHGEGYRADRATALANPELLSIASDAYLRAAVANGRSGTTMSAWSRARGGPLDDQGIDALVALMRSWSTKPYASVDGRTVTGDPARGQPIYARECAHCHGDKGTGGPYLPLANPELLASASDGFLAASIERGRPGTPMPAFATRLDAPDRDDVVALIRSWQAAPAPAGEKPPAPGHLEDVVRNPGGPEPALDASSGFVPVDSVKAELDRGATLVLIDARPGSDYVASHVTGAISVPFYEVEPYMAQIPRERFIVTYCGCPHAESGRVRDTLKQNGYPRVAVMDEGFYAWRDRGYPVKSGAKP